jgi:hypothetical protein
MSYWQHGDPVKNVKTLAGLPTCFTWQGEMHSVKRVAKTWRVDNGWWVQRVWRDHFKLLTKTGLLLILAHDLITDEWLLIRLYD